MYSRARRVTDLCSESASTVSVGPGSYNIQTCAAERSDSFAPFLSLSSRPPVFHLMNSEQCSPGPAHYNKVLTWAPGAGGCSLQNCSRRFKESESNIPGPGTYDIIQPWGEKRNLPTTQDRGIKCFRRLFNSVPSIPTPSQAFGYEESGDGKLCRQKPPGTDQSLGPAYYNPTQVKPNYKGIHFGRMTGKRTGIRVVEGPGPGHYHPEEDHSVCYENVNLKQELKSAAELWIPRYPELLILQENKKAVPGPGQYDVKGQFEKLNKGTKSRAAFMSHTPRFCIIKDVVPPVGSYNDPRCALESLKKPRGMERIPFNLTAARFPPENKKNTMPGPGTYNLLNAGLANKSLKKAQLGGRRETGFGSTTTRTTNFIRNTTEPGPAHYTVGMKRPELCSRPSAVFKSTLQRLCVSNSVQDTPSPSSYNVQVPYEKVFGHRGCAEPRTTAARKRQSSFLSTAPRNSTHHSDSHIPGPGHYSPDIRICSQFALISCNEDRFIQPKNTTPGPGAYTLSSMFLDTLLKHSFNMTLQTNMTSQPLAPPLECAVNSAFTFTTAEIPSGSKIRF